MNKLLVVLFLLMQGKVSAQQLRGKVTDADGNPMAGVTVVWRAQNEQQQLTDAAGRFSLAVAPPGVLLVFAPGHELLQQSINQLPAAALELRLVPLRIALGEIEVRQRADSSFSISRLRAVEGFGIYAARKTELVVVQEVTANLATNNARQLLAKVAGLNIWESDGAGLQLGIGARGLSPNRTSNFNVRQNGYDIAADALGYPESYYTPPAEALERIALVRGAASLQYGTQFGGMINFELRGAPDSGLAVLARSTVGSFGFRSLFAQAGYRRDRTTFTGYINYKTGNGWRPNSAFDAFTGYAQVGRWSRNRRIYQTLAFTRMHYLAQQAGGLTDFQFAENPRQSVRPRNWFTIDWNLAAHELSWDISSRTRLNSRTFGLYARRAAVGNLERINVADQVTGNRSLIDGYYRNIGHESRLLHRIGLSQLLVGIRLYQGITTARQGDASADSSADFSLLNPDRPEGSDYRFPNRNAALFAEYLWQLNERWSVTAGLRAEYIHTQATGHYRQRVFDFAGNLIVDNRIDEQLQRERSFVLGGFGVSYKPQSHREWYLNVAQNYRAINFSDLRIVNPNFRVDPELTDERGYTADLGYRGRLLPWLQADGSLFLLWYANKIGQLLKSDQAPLFLDYRLRTNVAAARSVGGELLLEADLARSYLAPRKQQLRLFVNTAFTDARYLNSAEPGIAGNRVELVPTVVLRGGVHYRYQQLRAGLQCAWVSSHYSDATNAERTATAVEGRIPAYWVADFSLSYSYQRWAIEASINNLFNQAYFTRRAEAYPGPGIIPSDGRSFFVSLVYRLKPTGQ
jgi:Fe(3+) dicitrate transport protein